MEEAAKYLFFGAAAIALFTFLTVTHWITTRSAERRDRDRLALLRKAAEQPASAEPIRQLLREEDARLEAQARHKAAAARRDGLQSGLTVIAVGVGLSIFLYAVASDERVWTVGIMVMLVGLVTAVFAVIQTHVPAPTREPRNGES